MKVTLSTKELQFAALFEEETDVAVKDCLVEDDHAVVLVPAGEIAQAIGAGGKRVQGVEQQVGKSIKVVENADSAANFVANALAPAAVYNVTISEGEERIAYAEVADDDRGAAIGSDGTNIEAARELAERHHDIDEIKLT
jgi:N utilization substance protein A